MPSLPPLQLSLRWATGALMLVLLTTQCTIATPVPVDDPPTSAVTRPSLDTPTFAYQDKSCSNDRFKFAAEDLLALADAIIDLFIDDEDPGTTQLKKKTVVSFLGSGFEESNKKGATALRDGLRKLHIWCDDSALKYVTTHQEGPDLGKPTPENEDEV